MTGTWIGQGGQYTGGITSAVPEPATYAMLLAGLVAIGGMVLSLAPGVPVSVFVAFISFGIYLVCRVIGRVQG